MLTLHVLTKLQLAMFVLYSIIYISLGENLAHHSHVINSCRIRMQYQREWSVLVIYS